MTTIKFVICNTLTQAYIYKDPYRIMTFPSEYWAKCWIEEKNLNPAIYKTEHITVEEDEQNDS